MCISHMKFRPPTDLFPVCRVNPIVGLKQVFKLFFFFFLVGLKQVFSFFFFMFWMHAEDSWR